PHTARNDDLAVLGHGLANGAERLRLGGIKKAAGVDDDDVRTRVGLGQLIAFSPQARDDALGIDERLRTAEGNKTDLGSVLAHACRHRLRAGIATGVADDASRSR